MNKLISLFIVTLSFIFVLVTEIKASDICEKEEKYSQVWYYNNCDKPQGEKNTPWKGYENLTSSEIPQDANPDYKILKHYLKKYIDESKDGKKVTIKKSKNYKEFDFNLKQDENVIKAFSDTALLSYLMYVDGQIVIDEITPKDRFGKIFKNNTLYVSNSAGKSIMSYVYGHAVCRGHVNGIYQPMDWDVLENTLYENQPIINILNMASGTQLHIDTKGGGTFYNSKKWANRWSINDLAKEELKNTKPGINKYHYANLNTNVFASYVMATMGKKEYKKMLNDIFQNKIGIQYNVVMKQPSQSKKSDLSMTYGMHLTRYDYMRVAVAMLNDWNNNTCEGQYLKSLYENRIVKNEYGDKKHAHSNATHYAGQFHTYADNPIFIIDGFAGQTITIDFENKKIVSTMSIHRDYNWLKLVNSKF